MKLRDYMKINKIKNRDLALQIGVHPGSVPRYKRPRANPPTHILNRIIKATGGQVCAVDFDD